jgi:hypothetical protein
MIINKIGPPNKKGSWIMSLFLFIMSSGYAQSSISYEGIIHVSKKESYPYLLKIKLDTIKQSFVGYSIFNMNKSDETKSLLTGQFKDKRVEFKEYKVMFTRSKQGLDNMCYIHFSGEQKKLLGNDMIVGKFVGYYNNGKKCGEGTINFLNKEKANERLDSFFRNKKDDSIVSKSDLKSFIDGVPITKKDNEETTLIWKSDSLKFIIWDNDKVDNDKVRLFINGKIVKDLNLTQTSYEYVRAFTEDVIIEIIALNNGFFPPNTSRILFLDHTDKFYFSNSLNENSSIQFKIIRKTK